MESKISLIWPLEGRAWQSVELRMVERTREMLIPMLSEIEIFPYVTKKSRKIDNY